MILAKNCTYGNRMAKNGCRIECLKASIAWQTTDQLKVQQNVKKKDREGKWLLDKLNKCKVVYSLC